MGFFLKFYDTLVDIFEVNAFDIHALVNSLKPQEVGIGVDSNLAQCLVWKRKRLWQAAGRCPWYRDRPLDSPT